MVIQEPGEKDITIRQGCTFERVFRLTDSTRTLGVSLAGYSGRGQVRDKPGGELLLTFSVTVDQTVDPADPDTGKVTVTAAAADTALMTEGGVYDIEIVQGAVVERFVQGSVSLDPGVTQP